MPPRYLLFRSAHRRFGRALFPALAAAAALTLPLARGEVLISEFMALNQTALPDDDGEFSDWIEVVNTGPDSVDLAGYHLTDNAGNLGKWTFPSKTLAAGQVIVVFASGKDRRDPAAPLHTNFKLAGAGEYLALTAPGGNAPAHEFAPAFPPQSVDISYGISGSNDPETTGQFSPSTPGSINGTTFYSAIPEVIFSRASGTFTDPFSLTLSGAGAGETIRYTTNRSLPTAASTLYTAPISIAAETTMVRARVFSSGGEPGPVRSETFLYLSPAGTTLYLNSSIRNFTSDLPIMVVETFGVEPPTSKTPVPMHWTVYEPQGPSMRSSLLNSPDLATRGRATRRGSSTVGWAKYSTSLEAWDEDDMDKGVTPLGLPRDSDWILSGRWEFDRALMRNPFIYEVSRRVGRYAVRTRFVEVFYSRNNTTLENADYMGVYTFMEKIKVDDDRVDIANLRPEDNTPPEVTGGYIFKKDRLGPGESGINVGGMGSMAFHDPDEKVITSQQRSYLTGYLNELNAALQAQNYINPTTGKHYSEYLDPASWIDHMWLNVVPKNVDALRLSAYFFKDKNDVVHAGPIWDFDRTMESTDGRDDAPDTWYGTGDATRYFEYPWWNRLHDDPDYYQAWVDRWFELRESVFTTETFNSIIDGFAAELAEAQARNFVRWSDRPPRFGSHQGEVNHLKNWLGQRLAWIDTQFPSLPGLSTAGGPVAAGSEIDLDSPDAEVFFTTDGSDPRAPGGGVSASATSAGGGISAEVILAEGAVGSYFVPAQDIGAAWRGLSFDDSGWASGPGGWGFESAGQPLVPHIATDIKAAMQPPGMFNSWNATAYIRIPFAAAVDIGSVESMTLKMRYDDGFVAYLNGVKIAENLAPASPAWNSSSTGSRSDEESAAQAPFDITASAGVLQTGDNVLAIHIMNSSPFASDVLALPSIEYGRLQDASLTVNETALYTLRTFDGSVWSAPVEAYFLVGEQRASAANVVVSEMMYHPAEATASEIAAGFTNEDDFEFIELMNISGSTVNLFESAFSDGIGMELRNLERVSVAPGERVLIVANRAAFEARYGIGFPIIGEYAELSGDRFSNDGEPVRIDDYSGVAIKEFTYNDQSPWPETADGEGPSMILVDPRSNPDHALPGSWTASPASGGTPGVGESAYELWKLDQRLFADQSDTDHDGLSLFLEYALGLNPLLADPPPVAIAPAPYIVDGSQAEYLTVAFIARDTPELSHQVESATESLAWSPAAVVLVESQDLGGGLRRFVYRSADPIGSVDSQFLRVRFSENG